MLDLSKSQTAHIFKLLKQSNMITEIDRISEKLQSVRLLTAMSGATALEFTVDGEIWIVDTDQFCAGLIRYTKMGAEECLHYTKNNYKMFMQFPLVTAAILEDSDVTKINLHKSI